ncbi:MAG TPA: YcnI family protein [Jatrophihabitans sp.]|nr:YcnI family protein [Jatrophihabitans sp.]
MRRFLLVLLGVFAAMIAFAVSAAAHVTVSAPGATTGGNDAQITFRVPVEKDVPTVGLTIQLPTDTPIASVDVAAMPGWTHTQKTTKLAKPIETDDGQITTAVSQITWKATGRGLEPGEYGSFTMLAGQLPDASSLTFKALQTYSDGSVVRWIETPAPGSKDEPEHPAPVLTLSAEESDSSSAPSNTGPVVLSIVALVLAAAALGVAVVGRVRRRSP